MRATIRLIGVALLLIAFAIETVLVRLAVWSPKHRRRWAAARTSRTSRGLLAWLNIKVDLRPATSPMPAGGLLSVANHVSYLDILIAASTMPFVFVTTEEMRRYPLLGFLSRLAECVFVERRSTITLMNDIGEIGAALKEGRAVMLFPEGTSFNGSAVRPFHSPFFEAAARTGVPIVPLCFNYETVDGRPFTRTDADSVFWYGGLGFVQQAWRLLRTGPFRVRVTRLPSIGGTPGHDRKNLSRQAEDAIRASFVPIPLA